MSVIRGVLSWFRDAFGPGPRTADGRRSGGSMDIKRDRMVFLGYGKYWRSDSIIGLMPIEEERGPKRRTNVFVQGRADPIIASRTEQSILDDMGATGDGFQVQALREAITELLAAFHEVSPALRRTLQSEHHLDLEQWEQRLGEIMRAPQTREPVEQNDLFE